MKTLNKNVAIASASISVVPYAFLANFE